MQRLLLIGLDKEHPIVESLSGAGYELLSTAPDESSLRDAFEAFRPEALILALGEDLLLLQHLRRLLRSELNAHPIPLLALARRQHLLPAQLVVGVDDFILPPYGADELLARVQMLLWRHKRVNAQNRVQSGGLVVDLAQRTASADGRLLALTLREYQLLQFLMTHGSRTFTRESLLAQVWGYQFEGDIRVVDVYIKRVRAKLPAPYRSRVETVRGVGYRFREEEAEKESRKAG